MGFSEKINQAQSVSDDLTESQNLCVFYAMSAFFSINAAMPSESGLRFQTASLSFEHSRQIQ
ncbi:hypothetical protein COH34_09580 [Neisseria meningitidis]|nr:hypothetical protein COI36_10220 [Neisseria meningitidis]RNK23002.1 hypothetical protein COH91_10335 [Neisseria meningitidis]RNK36351.1 hypothetical protein COH88_06635 [Neisseria meningitidis]RNL17017.1 hypothetical protein COH85_03175 [Neisseria meningitidis]RQJ63285.1 hypothetical protein COI15_09240 [Neisseria meningitidis]